MGTHRGGTIAFGPDGYLYIALGDNGGQHDPDCIAQTPTILHGKVLRIGPNLAQGDEMNRASKLGEDIANARETLVTENVVNALAGRDEFVFSPLPAATVFPYFRASGRG